MKDVAKKSEHDPNDPKNQVAQTFILNFIYMLSCGLKLGHNELKLLLGNINFSDKDLNYLYKPSLLRSTPSHHLHPWQCYL
jgi:hypothetical protein